MKNIRIPIFDHSATPNAERMPPWVRQSLAKGEYATTAQQIESHQLNTVCSSARCPNKGECWGRGTATFMLMGEICTRSCGFCAVYTGHPTPLESDEPQRIVAAAREMGVSYLVLTSVNRDELADGGAGHFAATIQALYQHNPELGIELLTPDFRGCQLGAIEVLGHALPEQKMWVWGHNVETVPSLYKRVRRGSDYQRSLTLLQLASLLPNIDTKSSLMLGLGEQEPEVVAVLEQLRTVGVSRIALGQYLRPTRRHLPVESYIHPDQFARYEELALGMGFSWVKAGAMVRSSYHAETPVSLSNDITC